MIRTLHDGFLESARRFPSRPALRVDDDELTYRSLRERASGIGQALQAAGDGEGRLCAVLAERSVPAFAGVLGALLSGAGYVPLNPRFPVERTREMLRRSGCRSLVVDEAGAALLDELLDGPPVRYVLLFPDRDDVSAERARYRGHTVLGRRDVAPTREWSPPTAGPDDLAYLLFTSGSTGVPKGVAVTRGNVARFVRTVTERYRPTEHDRFSQTFDLTFDLSAFDMFVCWGSGACLCSPPPDWSSDPGSYILDSGLTFWFSVPSVALLSQRGGLLRPGRFPSLRWSLFCGEPLRADVARAWANAARAAALENLYGPTELTIACTAYRWDPETSPAASRSGIVPIGRPFPEMEALVVGDALEEVEPGSVGELLMSGPQMCAGYWDDSERTAASFVVPPGRDDVYYRTGDLVCRPSGEAPFLYVGRADHQVKIRGYRVELGEIESVLRAHPSVLDTVVAAADGEGGDLQLVAYVLFDGPPPTSARDLVDFAATRLPTYMVPVRVVSIADVPLSPNGKVDRGRLPDHAGRQLALGDGRRAAGPLEAEIVSIWEEVLGLDAVGRDDRFLLVGGDSLSAAQVLLRIRERLGVALEPRDIFEAPTVAALAARVEEAGAAPDRGPEPRPLERGDREAPLAPDQERLLFLHEWSGRSPALHVPIVLRVEGAFDVQLFGECVEAVARRHDALGSRFVARGRRYVQAEGPVPEVEVVARGVDASARPQEADVLVRRALEEPFDLAERSWRVRVVRVSSSEHLLVFVFHHMVFDEWSRDVLFAELSELYAAWGAGRAAGLAELPVRYGDYARWAHAAAPTAGGDLGYWLDRLRDYPVRLSLPQAANRVANPSWRSLRTDFVVPLELVAGAERLAVEHGTTPFTVFFSAYAELLHRESGQDRFIVGVPYAVRPDPALEPLIGFFTRTLAVPVDAAPGRSPAELVEANRDTVLEALSRNRFRFDELARGLDRSRDAHTHPVFQTWFTFYTERAALRLPGATTQRVPLGTGYSSLDVALELTMDPAGELRASFDLAEDLFEGRDVGRYVDGFLEALRALVGDPRPAPAVADLAAAGER